MIVILSCTNWRETNFGWESTMPMLDDGIGAMDLLWTDLTALFVRMKEGTLL